MSLAGDADVTIRARSVLLDALTALDAHAGAVIVIGAQALYLRTGAAVVALAETTKDTDIALDVRVLADEPLIEQAMTAAAFELDNTGDPGRWLSPDGIPVDLMVAEALAGPSASQRRGARIPPHSKRAARRAVGLEAAMVDFNRETIAALDPADRRALKANVAGPAALLVAKLHKIAERSGTPSRLVDKDAHDIHRLFQAIPTASVAVGIARLLADDLSAAVTLMALTYLRDLFGTPTSLGSTMAGRAEEGLGDPATVAAQISFLASDLLAVLADPPWT
jgi:hypothetical protein